MNSFFATIYEIFLSLYNQSLGYHLYGYDCDYTIVNQSGYTFVGFWMIGISIAVAVLFYYVINSTLFNLWYHWLIMVFINAGINFFVAYDNVNSDMLAHAIPECFVKDPQSGLILIDSSSCIGFGFANSIVATIIFIIASLSIRWWSKNCSTCPIPN